MRTSTLWLFALASATASRAADPAGPATKRTPL